MKKSQSSKETLNGKHSIDFLYQNEIDYLLYRIFQGFDYFSHEEVSSAYHLFKFLLRNADKPFTPFYDDGSSLNNQVRKGWIRQINLLPPRFTNRKVSRMSSLDTKIKEILGGSSDPFYNVVDDLLKVDDKKSWLKNMQRATVAYQLPEHLKLTYLIDSGIDKEHANNYMNKTRKYIKSFRKS